MALEDTSFSPPTQLDVERKRLSRIIAAANLLKSRLELSAFDTYRLDSCIESADDWIKVDDLSVVRRMAGFAEQTATEIEARYLGDFLTRTPRKALY